MTKDQSKAESFGPIWSLTIEPLWYKLTLDTQVPVFTYLSLFYFLPFDCSYGFSGCKCCILSTGEKMRMWIKTWWRLASFELRRNKCWGFASRPECLAQVEWVPLSVLKPKRNEPRAWGWSHSQKIPQIGQRVGRSGRMERTRGQSGAEVMAWSLQTHSTTEEKKKSPQYSNTFYVASLYD